MKLLPVQHLPVRRLDHRRVGVTQRDRAQTHAVLDEFVAIEIPDVAALAAGDEAGRALRPLVVSLGVGVRAAGNDVVNLAPHRQGFLEIDALYHRADGLGIDELFHGFGLRKSGYG